MGAKLFCGLVVVAALRAGRVIREHGARRLQLVVDLWYDDDVAVACDVVSRSPDGARNLKDLAI